MVVVEQSDQPSQEKPVRSPCIGLCQLEPPVGANQQCIACLRTLDEIVGWQQMNNDQKRAVLAQLKQRRAAQASTAEG